MVRCDGSRLGADLTIRTHREERRDDPGSVVPDVGYHGVVGFNPFRKQRRSGADIVMVVGAIVAAIAGLVWAISGI